MNVYNCHSRISRQKQRFKLKRSLGTGSIFLSDIPQGFLLLYGNLGTGDNFLSNVPQGFLSLCAVQVQETCFRQLFSTYQAGIWRTNTRKSTYVPDLPKTTHSYGEQILENPPTYLITRKTTHSYGEHVPENPPLYLIARKVMHSYENLQNKPSGTPLWSS